VFSTPIKKRVPAPFPAEKAISALPKGERPYFSFFLENDPQVILSIFKCFKMTPWKMHLEYGTSAPLNSKAVENTELW
jgi:hypothetical protein